MTSILPQLEQDLRAAADRRLPAGSAAKRTSRRRGVRGGARRLPLVLFSLAGLLAATTAALAASGVILTGAPVHPSRRLGPKVGVGVPAPGQSRLLPLRVSDPEGGLPWGMRIVRTTRGEVCLQIGRIEHGKLGELGVDGAFHDDGRFHPLPPKALPAPTSRGGLGALALAGWTSNTACPLAGNAIAGEGIGLDRSAAASVKIAKRPRRDLRDISYGLLGAQAVSVTYRAGAKHRTERVVPGSGAYLLVRRTGPRGDIGAGSASLGTPGKLKPTGVLSAITYRLGGKICQRGAVEPPGATAHLAHPCPTPHWQASRSTPMPDLHAPVHVHLQVSHHLVLGAVVSFAAPLAVTSARHAYTIFIPAQCGRGGSGGRRRGERFGCGGGNGASIDRDVKAGATVRHWFSAAELFAARRGSSDSARIEVLYARAGEPGRPQLAGSATVALPASDHVARTNTVPTKECALAAQRLSAHRLRTPLIRALCRHHHVRGPLHPSAGGR